MHILDLIFGIRDVGGEVSWCYYPYYAHTQELFRAHNILPYELLLNQAKLHFMHSYVYGYAPKSFNNTWIKNNQREIQHNLCNNDDFMLPMARIELFKKIPMYSFPLALNAVGDIRFQQNKTTFRWGLTLIQPGEVKTDLANFDVKFRTKFLYVRFFYLTYSCRNVLQIFLNFWHNVKKFRFNIHFDVFSSKVGPRRHIVDSSPSA